MSLRLAAHWLTVTFTAAAASLIAALPFTGQTASAIGTLAAAVVCLVGIALAPATRKDRT